MRCKRFARRLTLNDKDWRVWANLMISYQWLKDDTNIGLARDKARAAIEQELTVTPQNAQAHALLSTYYAQENLREKALSQVHTALALEPKDGNVLAKRRRNLRNARRPQARHRIARDSVANGYELGGLETQPALKPVLADPNFRASGKK